MNPETVLDGMQKRLSAGTQEGVAENPSGNLLHGCFHWTLGNADEQLPSHRLNHHQNQGGYVSAPVD
jgi:hypothetical protein